MSSLLSACVSNFLNIKIRAGSKLKVLQLGSAGTGCIIYPTARIYNARYVALGNRVAINDFVHIWGGGGVEIGDDSMIASHCAVVSQTHDADALQKGKKYRETMVTTGPVIIGKNVWIGTSAVILPGVRIGDHAIIGAGAVVTRDIPSRTIVAGSPARKLRDLNV